MEEIKNKNKKMVIIVTILVVFIGITLAYIIAQISGSAIGNANITADTTDNLQFNIDKDITLNPTQFNVVEGGGGLSDTATGTASLLANSTNKSATFDYYVYFQINTNEYIYTTEDYKTEIVLTITDPEGNPVTKLANSDLKYVEAENADGTTVSGFDITTASGLINITSNYEITSSSSTQATEQDWIFTVTFINLTTNQAANGGSTLDAEIILSKDVTNYHEICEPGTMACDIARLYNEENPETNGLYYHNGTIVDENEYCMFEGNQVSSFPNGISTSAEDCNTVYSFAGMYYDASVITDGLAEGIVEEVTWDSVNSVCETTSGIPVYNDNETAVSQESCNGYAAVMGDSSVIMINVGSGTMELAVLDAEDYSYRYSGANPNNYVCFGSDEGTCSNDDLYRIIGVFDGQVKLIKYDYATSEMLGTNGDYYGTSNASRYDTYKGSQSTLYGYYWNEVNYDLAYSETGYRNVWSYSELNKTNLNTNYLNYLGEEWAEKIATTEWKVGGMGYDAYQSSFKVAYDYEVNNPNADVETTYKSKIGLMYVTDYVYGATPKDWNTTVGYYAHEGATDPNNNWIYMGYYDWTISRYSDNPDIAVNVNVDGVVDDNFANNYSGVRPSFSLKSSVVLSGGSGSSADPYRIA